MVAIAEWKFELQFRRRRPVLPAVLVPAFSLLRALLALLLACLSSQFCVDDLRYILRACLRLVDPRNNKLK